MKESGGRAKVQAMLATQQGEGVSGSGAERQGLSVFRANPLAASPCGRVHATFTTAKGRCRRGPAHLRAFGFSPADDVLRRAKFCARAVRGGPQPK